jgi:dipeptidyl aminopeptidase/acylaminoacyl peptidase
LLLQADCEELVTVIQVNEVTLECLVFSDEGHGFTKRDDRIIASNDCLRFLAVYLKGAEKE